MENWPIKENLHMFFCVIFCLLFVFLECEEVLQSIVLVECIPSLVHLFINIFRAKYLENSWR